MNDTTIWISVVGIAVTNITVRLLPIAVLSRLKLPPLVERWLSFVPVCVMAAIFAQEVLRPGGRLMMPWSNPYLIAAIPTAFTYRVTRSLFGSTVVGVLAFLAMRYLLG